MIQPERIKFLNQKAIKKGDYVLYWMQAAQRGECNHALEYAILKANELGVPVLVYFGLTDRLPEANQRHYFFMLEGLREVRMSLKERGIRMAVCCNSPERGAIEFSRQACLVVTDRGYLRVQREWRQAAAQGCDCLVVQVESDVIVPVETASPKEEYAAATIRPKIKKQWAAFLTPLREHEPQKDSLALTFDSLDLGDPEKVIIRLNIDRSVGPVNTLHGGTSAARHHLDMFLKQKLNDYPEQRNDPNRDVLSNMSPYLHFGQISPLFIALEVMKTGSPASEAYLEELIIRRELSMNFVFYNPHYDNYPGLPEWARKTLAEHQKDPRQYLYSLEDLEQARSHDPYWNAAQLEMVHTGKMHGYMRMYWGKKILEWTETPQQGFRFALYLNNKYELDGRDPNGFTGTAWCFGKHDRAWAERPIFGKIRYMNANGLKRKFDADAYVKKIRQITSAT
jgi:deoxyribodipyrimidine photo-lyase